MVCGGSKQIRSFGRKSNDVRPSTMTKRNASIARALEQMEGIMRLCDDYQGPDALMRDIKEWLMTEEITVDEAIQLILADVEKRKVEDGSSC